MLSIKTPEKAKTINNTDIEHQKLLKIFLKIRHRPVLLINAPE